MKGPGVTERILYLHIRILYLCVLSSLLLFISLTNSVKDVSIPCTPVLGGGGGGDAEAALPLAVRDLSICTDRRLMCGWEARSARSSGFHQR